MVDHEEFVKSYDRSVGEAHHGEVYKLPYESVADAAAFAAFRAFEKKQMKEGKQVEHALAKELIAGLVAVETIKLIKTKRLDFIDKNKALYQARKAAHKLYDEQYGHETED
ncbi:10177_t:CDS:2 [Ambispora gerdemannii]|uniref:10177_t:CDS:1 n=1 Tax=Ambispora gerdemannii TaxID=144530 RepID=A0A9N8ZML3_9GLOM|nr:10177_t:CDS:2 [Ambispora gerdemannii]